MTIVVAALYKFFPFSDYKEWRQRLKELCLPYDIRGTLLLAPEGINGTVAGPRDGIDALLSFLKSDVRMKDLEHKESYTERSPFYRLKVRLKKEIVTLGVKGLDPANVTGKFLDPHEWNELLQDPDVQVIDTRNLYEVAIGTFKGALDPKTNSFRDFPKYIKEHFKNKKQRIAMFCTGGIRCEKASSYMLAEGFDEVYQLKGGILKYLETIPMEKSLWEGECFVFDNRVAVKEGVAEGDYDLCFGCRYPLSDTDKTSTHYEEGVHCPQCFDKKSPEKVKRLRERQRQIKIAKNRHQDHIGQRFKGAHHSQHHSH